MSVSESQTREKSWRDTFTVYFHQSILLVFVLGFASGFPLLLTMSTLTARLTESQISVETIGIFALIGLPYTLKFLFAPFIDAIHLPHIKTHLAHRKSWCILTQICLALSILGMALFDPSQNLMMVAIFALLTASFSAAQDVVIDALRVEMLHKDSQGAGAAAAVTGYRIGMLVAGAGSFVMASYCPWNIVYLTAACLMALCIIPTCGIRRLDGYDDAMKDEKQPEKLDLSHGISGWFYRVLVAPLADFLKRPSAITILFFIALFKLGDSMCGALSTKFYLDLEFTKIEIAAITKTIGFAATILGTFVGGFIVKQLSIYKSLFLCGILMLLSNFVFVWLANVGHRDLVLALCIAIENVSGGMGTAAFVAYMSQLCNVKFTATQYALLSSLSSIGRTLISSTAGFMVAGLGWSMFYVATAFFGLPGLLLLYVLYRKSRQEPQSPAISSAN